MANKKDLFYVRIDFVDLMDFATDDDGKNMSLLQFAKELKKPESSYPKIQHIINEAHAYIAQKKTAGKLSAEKRAKIAEEKKLLLEQIEKLKASNDAATEVNGVERRSNDAATEVNGDRTNNSNNNRTTYKPPSHNGNDNREEYYDDGIWEEQFDGTFLNRHGGEIRTREQMEADQ